MPPIVVTYDIFAKVDDYMDNMANAVTNKKAVIEKLVATNTNQASTIATKVITIITLSDEVNQLQLRIIYRGGKLVEEESPTTSENS